jgi:hypothetical protein
VIFGRSVTDAFNAISSRHPEDAAMLVTQDIQNLPAVYYPGVRGVIVECAADADVVKALAKMPLPRTVPVVHSRPSELSAANLPAAIVAQAEKLSQISHALEHLENPGAAHGYKLLCDNFSGIYAESAAKRTMWTLPHFDEGIYLQLISNMTLQKEFTTGWYPGAWTGPQVDDLGDAIQRAADPQKVMRDAGRQALPPHHILAYRGDAGRPDKSIWLMHDGPKPAPHAVRYGFVHK